MGTCVKPELIQTSEEFITRFGYYVEHGLACFFVDPWTKAPFAPEYFELPDEIERRLAEEAEEAASHLDENTRQIRREIRHRDQVYGHGCLDATTELGTPVNPIPGTLFWQYMMILTSAKGDPKRQQHRVCPQLACNAGLSRLLLVDLDIDSTYQGTREKAASFKAWETFQQAHGPLPKTWTIETPRLGRHMVYRDHHRRGKNTQSKLGPMIDTRGENGYFLVEGSICSVRDKKTGKFMRWGQYVAVPGLTLDEIGIAEAPEWLFDMCEKAPLKEEQGPDEPIDGRETNLSLSKTPMLDLVMAGKYADVFYGEVEMACWKTKYGKDWQFEDLLKYHKYAGERYDDGEHHHQLVRFAGTLRNYIWNTALFRQYMEQFDDLAIVSTLRPAHQAHRDHDTKDFESILRDMTKDLPQDKAKVIAKIHAEQARRKQALDIVEQQQSSQEQKDEKEKKLDFYKTWKGYDMTDAGNAQRFLDQYEGVVRYCPEKDVWFVWSGRHWEVDKRNVIRTTLSTVLNTLEAQEEVTTDDLTRGVNFGLTDDKERKRYIRTVKDFAQKSQSSYALAGALEKAKADAGKRNLIVTFDDFDRNRWHFNTDNALLDLNTQQSPQNNTITVIPHTPQYFVSKLAGPKHMRTEDDRFVGGIHYDPSAQCPLWMDFLQQFTCGRPDLMACLQTLVGYSMTGWTKEQIFIVLYGGGGAGKGTFLRLMSSLFGDYSDTLPFTSLTKQKFSTNDRRDDIAGVRHCRFVYAQEGDDDEPFDEALVKWLTGEDEIKVRLLRENFAKSEPEFTLWLATNHIPRVRHQDESF
jgi:phage/plasmid-associated DNA primase